MNRLLMVSLALVGSLEAREAVAATINVTAADTADQAETKIESAQPGDTVLIGPGTYAFLVYLTHVGTPSAPIVIRAADPSNRPKWDLTGIYTENAPGHYTASDRDRGCWQVNEPAAYYAIEGIEFHQCHSDPNVSGNAGGIRFVRPDHLTIRACLFDQNDNGIIGGGDDVVVEFSEFSRNGSASSDQIHSIYILGGSTFTLRFSYVHDALGGQNLHLRAHDNRVVSNWIARAGDYEGDLDTFGASYDRVPSAANQSLVFAGNVVLTSPSAANTTKVLGLFNDGAVAGLAMTLTAVWNTFVVQAQGANGVVQVRNDQLASAAITFSNNVVVGTSSALVVAAPGMPNLTAAGDANLFPTGAAVTPLSGTLFGDPGFTNAAALDFTLGPASMARGAADVSAPQAPSTEYFQNETVTAMYRVRGGLHDVGAFDHTTTGPGIGPYDDVGVDAGTGPSGDGGLLPDGANVDDGGGPPGPIGATGSAGCGCVVLPPGGMPGTAGAAAMLASSLLVLARRLRRPRWRALARGVIGSQQLQ